jgi:branched-chain amino acid transport system permease protein
MSSFLQLLVSGLATGAIYALVAVGFSLLWQASQTINFAQGEFVMVPAFFVLVGMQMLGLPFPIAALLGIGVAALLLGYLFKRVVVTPMIQHGLLPLVVATIALSIFMREAAKDFYSAQALPFPSLVADRDITIFGTVFSLQSLTVLAVALLVTAALHLFLQHTRLGRMMQATAQNRNVAVIIGVNVERMILLTFVINAVLCAIASILISPIYLAKFTNGDTLGQAAFVAAIIGGFNQARGAMLGGLLLGMLDNLCAAYLSAPYRAALPLFLLVAFILFRPQGLMGRVEERTV